MGNGTCRPGMRRKGKGGREGMNEEGEWEQQREFVETISAASYLYLTPLFLSETFDVE